MNRKLFFAILCLWAAVTVDGLTTGSGDSFANTEFFSVSSATASSTGKRTEDGVSIHVIHLHLPHLNQSLPISLQPMVDPNPGCTWTRKFGDQVVEEKPCPPLEAYHGLGDEEHLSFLAYIDSGRTLMKGFFHLEGETYFVDPTFEHMHNLKTLGKMHLTAQPMVVYKKGNKNTGSQKSNDGLFSALHNQQRRNAELVPAATTSIRYPAPPFGSGQCTMRKTVTIRYHLDHSFVNRFNSDRNAFRDPFPDGAGNDWQTWNDITSYVRVYGTAISKYVYEKSVGITMAIDKVEIHDTPGDTAWNQRGTSSVDRNGNNRYNCPLDIEGILDAYTKWAQAGGAQLGSTGTVNHLITDCQRLFPGEGGTVGLAWVGVICSSSNTGTCTFLSGADGYQCSAHEIGHNFGAPHDFRSGNQDIMSYESSKYDGFSDNTYQAICQHLANQGYRCLKDSSSTPPTCTPQCNGKICGSDGCGGLCGNCKFGQTCTSQGTCIASCTPNCMGRRCGSDGCSGTCGSCGAGTTCSNGLCVGTCTPNCVNKGCGMSDGCGGICGTGCDMFSASRGYKCDATTGWKCVPPSTQPTPKPPCTPQCTGKTCGPNGCGGVCGTCGAGTTCNTVTSTCTCVPVTSCIAQRKTCGQLFDGCKYVTCGPDCNAPPTCTPNPNACLNKNCGVVSDGCKQIECGKCASQGTSMVCVNNKCTPSTVCGWCSVNAQCVNNGQSCVCRAGYTGDGFTCNPVAVPDPTSPDSWDAVYGSVNDWSLSDDGSVLSNVNPSSDSYNPSVIRWTGSKPLVSVTDVTLSAMIHPTDSSSIAGIAFALTSNKGYGMIGIKGTSIVARAGSPNRSSWYQFGTWASTFDNSQWINVTLVFSKIDQFSTVVKTYVNGQVTPPNCGASCRGYNASSMLGFSSLAVGDVGFFNLMSAADFTALRVTTKNTVYMTLGNCMNNDDLSNMASDFMNIDKSKLTIDNPCKKRNVEQGEVTVTVLVDPTGPLESAAIGPSTMAAQLESGGVIASSASTVPFTSVSTAVSAGAAGSTAATIAPVAESAILGGASSGLSAGAIAGIVIGSLVGVAVLGAAGYVAVQKMSEDGGSGGSSSQKESNMVLFNDMPSNAPQKPKGGIDVITNPINPSGHQSITARGVPLQHGNK